MKSYHVLNRSGIFWYYKTNQRTQMWHDQEEWIGFRRYYFWDTGQERAHNNFVTRYLILIGLASKCSIYNLPECGVKISNFIMRLISLDRVTYVIWSSKISRKSEILILRYSQTKEIFPFISNCFGTLNCSYLLNWLSNFNGVFCKM